MRFIVHCRRICQLHLKESRVAIRLVYSSVQALKVTKQDWLFILSDPLQSSLFILPLCVVHDHPKRFQNGVLRHR